MGKELLARRTFGNTSLEVPPVAMGCAPLGSMEDTFLYAVPEDEAIATVKAALASPFDYIDTAALYGDGVSEARVGMALKELGGLPEGAVLQTKAGRDPVDNNFRGETVKRRFERSLELLGVDRVDVVYLHDAEWTTFEEAMAPGGPVEVLRSFQDQGAFDYLGVASGPNDVELQYIETGLFDAVITHNRYTLLNTNANPVIDVAAAKGMAVLNAAPYGSGMLSRGPESYPRYAYQQAPDHLIARTGKIREICDRYGVPLAAAALQFSMLDPRITVTIVGMSRPDRVKSTVELASSDIPGEVWEEIDALGPADTDDPEIYRFKDKK
ncbi:MAG: aldo/keto reductase [Thermomicrobiales bacterium]